MSIPKTSSADLRLAGFLVYERLHSLCARAVILRKENQALGLRWPATVGNQELHIVVGVLSLPLGGIA